MFHLDSEHFIPCVVIQVQFIMPQALLDFHSQSSPKLEDFVPLADIPYDVEQPLDFMGVMNGSFFILIGMLQFLPKLHSVIRGEAIVEQLHEEGIQHPILFINFNTLKVKIIGCAAEII